MIYVLTETCTSSNAELEAALTAELAPTEVRTLAFGAKDARVGINVVADEHLGVAHLLVALAHAEAIVIASLPDVSVMAAILMLGVPCVLVDSRSAREAYGTGVIYAPTLDAEVIGKLIRHQVRDRALADRLVRRARVRAAHLISRPSASDHSEELAFPFSRIDFSRYRATRRVLDDEGSGPGSRLVPTGGGVLAILLAKDDRHLASVLDEIEIASLDIQPRVVVVLMTSDQELASRVRVISAGRAEWVAASETTPFAQAVSLGLSARTQSDRFVFWHTVGSPLPNRWSLLDLVAAHEEMVTAWTAMETRPRCRTIASGPELVDRLNDELGIVKLWDLIWLDRVAYLDETLSPEAANVELCLRAFRLGARYDLVPRMTQSDAVADPGLPSALPFTEAEASRIRCGILTPGLLNGGAERWMISLLENTGDRVQWQGVLLEYPDREDPSIRREIERTCPVLTGFSMLPNFASHCEVLVIWGIDEWPTRLPADYAGKVVLVAHGVDEWTGRLFRNTERADLLVGVSEVTRSVLRPEDRDRMWIIPNAVDSRRVTPTRSREAVRASWGVAADARVLGFLGRFVPQKDPLALARAVHYLSPEWVGVMVGWADELSDLQQAANAIAPGRVRWPGPTEDVGSALGAMDALLVSSLEEGFCYALAEAWRARVPTIATRVGVASEQPELIKVIPREAHGATLAAALLTDLSEPDETAARIERAYRFAETELSPECFGRRWSGALLSVAGRNPWGNGVVLPGIQVVITSYNVEPWLARCLASVEAALQGYCWMLCLADDGSTDRTWSIIEHHSSSARHVCRRRFPKARSAGQAKNRALGLGLRLRSQYPAVLFMDADDVMPRARITYLVREAVAGAHRLVHGPMRFNAAVRGAGVEAGFIVPAQADHQLSIGPPATVIHESLVPPDGRLFCEDLDAMEDGELWCRLELAGIHSVPLNGPVIHEYWPREGSVMWNERLEENRQRFWARVEELRSGRHPLGLEHLKGR